MPKINKKSKPVPCVLGNARQRRGRGGLRSTLKVALFDFDGTLSAKDANTEFFKYTFFKSPRQFLFLPVIAVAGVGKLLKPNGHWWRVLMRTYMTPCLIKKYAPEFIKQHKKNRFGWAVERIEAEKAAGAVAICISASPDFLLFDLVKDMGFDVVMCTTTDASKPWKVLCPSWGKFKVDLLNAWRDEVAPCAKLEVVRAYSDSKSDLPMMNLAKEQVWINPSTGCRI